MWASVESVSAPERISVDPSSIVNDAITMFPSIALGRIALVTPVVKQGDRWIRILPLSAILLGVEIPVAGFVTIPPCCRVTCTVIGVVVETPFVIVCVLPVPAYTPLTSGNDVAVNIPE
jgi:hypothetical protein